jgi:putative FmdB family regulatory protein
MPIYEFKCLKCNQCFEFLVMSRDDPMEMCCPHCKSENFERILSSTCYSVGAGEGNRQSGASVQTRNCSGGSCTTLNLPGHSR